MNLGKRCGLGVLVAMLLSGALQAADLAGTWKGTMDTQMGPTDVTIVIEPGEKLKGRVYAADFAADIENGKIEGDRFSSEIHIVYGTSKFEGTVSGDEMKLTVTGVYGDKYELVCKRQKQ
ncbi:MAG: hypothetical protein Kow00109_20240 [Acidobacteriota bacterium]